MPPKPTKPTSSPKKTFQLTSSAKPTLNLNPSEITPQTFKTLLSLYPATVTKLHMRKNALKLKPKAKSAKRKAQDLDTTLDQEQDPALEERIREETDKFAELDSWRYEEMPKVISGRRSKSTSKSKSRTQTQTKTMKDEEEEEGEEVVLDKEDLIRIMEWKLKHGHFRPTLMGMIKSNPEKLVLECTSSALSLLPSNPDADEAGAGDVFPKESLDALSKLRGVGIATASLVLSIITASDTAVCEVPFYSDDTFLWLCAGVYPGSDEKVGKYLKPNGDLGVKYNVNEYRLLWDAMKELRGRLNGGGEGGQERVRFVDIEKVAFVVKNFEGAGIDLSGDGNGDNGEVVGKGGKKVKI